ncbi:hypothetical protein ACN6MY_04355 [Peribacillus sp. B-H-3]|uniref:hypothetical protein n=1 Tax=Peribacillus sp. B-H-3 TaxID=3400420 RepID=UPI003B019333
MRDLNDAATAFFRIPVFFSHQNLFSLGGPDPPFTIQQQQFIIRMFKEIKKVLLFPRTLPNTEQYPDTQLENIRTMVNSSYGLAAALLIPNGPTNKVNLIHLSSKLNHPWPISADFPCFLL